MSPNSLSISFSFDIPPPKNPLSSLILRISLIFFIEALFKLFPEKCTDYKVLDLAID
jgi:hypothetical protein